MGRFVVLRRPRVLLFKGSALLLCILLLVVLHTEEEDKSIKVAMKISHEGDCSSLVNAETVSSRERSTERTQLASLSSKRRVPKGPDPIHNRRTGNGQKPPGKS